MILLGILVFATLLIIVFAAFGAAKQKERSTMSLKKAYLYLVSVISLVIWVIGAIMLLNLALKAWVFPKADMDYYAYAPCVKSVDPNGRAVECDPGTQAAQKKQAEDNRAAQKQRDAAQALAMIIVATPVWWGHWRLARKEV